MPGTAKLNFGMLLLQEFTKLTTSFLPMPGIKLSQMKMSLLVLIFSTLSYGDIFCQDLNKQSIADLQVSKAIELYNNYNDRNAPIYTGEAYIFYAMKMEGSPYFKTGDFTTGWVNYKGRKYDSLKLLYDVTRNMLVTQYPNNIYFITIQNQFIDSFFLSGHTFISLQENHKENLYSSGFFDLLYNGNVQFLGKYSESLMTMIEGQVIVTKFLNHDRYYIYKDGLYYMVNNKKDVYRVFADKLHDLKKMMRRNHIKLKRKNFETAMVKASAFYDQLTH